MMPAAIFPLSHLAVHGITGFFLLGVLGCAFVIPVVAWRFFSVLFEKDAEEAGAEQPKKPAA